MHGRVVVPHHKLSAEVLQALIEDFVTREGTDYGLHGCSLAQKHAAVLRQLETGEACILFDADSESVTLVRRDELPDDLPEQRPPCRRGGGEVERRGAASPGLSRYAALAVMLRNIAKSCISPVMMRGSAKMLSLGASSFA